MIRAQNLVLGSDDTHLARPPLIFHQLGNWPTCLFPRQQIVHLERPLLAADHQICHFQQYDMSLLSLFWIMH